MNIYEITQNTKFFNGEIQKDKLLFLGQKNLQKHIENISSLRIFIPETWYSDFKSYKLVETKQDQKLYKTTETFLNSLWYKDYLPLIGIVKNLNDVFKCIEIELSKNSHSLSSYLKKYNCLKPLSELNNAHRYLYFKNSFTNLYEIYDIN